MKRVVHLHIDRLVVDGLPAGGQKSFLAALESQFRASAERGDFANNGRVRIASLNAGELKPGSSPAKAASQVVRSIHAGIRRPNRGGAGNV